MSDNWKITRSLDITASADAVWSYVADLSRWEEWLVWNSREDKGVELRLKGPRSGVGAIAIWDSDKVRNTTEIVAAMPGERVDYTVVINPGHLQAQGSIELAASGRTTRVTWTYQGRKHSSAMFKLWYMSFSREIARGFEASLARLKRLVEAPAT